VNRSVAVFSAIALAAVALAGCSGPSPPSPVAAIPKLILDYQDNVTRIYLTSVNADVRYENLTVVLHNDNITLNSTWNATNLTFHAAKTFALVAETNLTFFIINASADESQKHYFYNTSIHIADATPDDPHDPLIYQAYIRDPPDGTTRPEGLPYRHVLAEG